MTIDRAIGLLKMAVPMKAVTIDEFNDFIEAVNMAIDALENLPSAEQEIIRCKDCKHYRSYAGVIDGYCGMAEWYGRYQYPNDFCSRAKRRTDE